MERKKHGGGVGGVGEGDRDTKRVDRDSLFVGWLVAQRPSNMLVCLRDDRQTDRER